jgi:cytochrome c oxidase assembly factor CtaG
MHLIPRASLLALALSLAPHVQAHNPLAGELEERLAGLLTALLLLGFWLVYSLGARRVRTARWRQVLFHATALLSVLALLGPLDDWAKTSTAAHMAQHMLLMVVIAPLWVFSRPLPALSAMTRRIGPFLWTPLLRLTARPITCAWLHGLAIWFWHLPLFYMAAVENPWWHALEHACFLLTALLFWWSVLRAGERDAPWGLLALLLTLMHTGFLGAVLTFAGTPLYDEARSLPDQQLAGLIMWVPGAIPYLLASAWVGHRWDQQLHRRRLWYGRTTATFALLRFRCVGGRPFAIEPGKRQRLIHRRSHHRRHRPRRRWSHPFPHPPPP